MTWIEYVKSIAGDDKNATIGLKSGVSEATVSRWDTSSPKPENVARFARSYGRPVLEAFIAAGFITAEEAQETPAARANPADISDSDLIMELSRRLEKARNDSPPLITQEQGTPSETVEDQKTPEPPLDRLGYGLAAYKAPRARDNED